MTAKRGRGSWYGGHGKVTSMLFHRDQPITMVQFADGTAYVTLLCQPDQVVALAQIAQSTPAADWSDRTPGKKPPKQPKPPKPTKEPHK